MFTRLSRGSRGRAASLQPGLAVRFIRTRSGGRPSDTCPSTADHCRHYALLVKPSQSQPGRVRLESLEVGEATTAMAGSQDKRVAQEGQWGRCILHHSALAAMRADASLRLSEALYALTWLISSPIITLPPRLSTP